VVTTRKSQILGPDGQPVEIELMTDEVARASTFGARAVHADQSISGLSPDLLGRIMQRAAIGDARAYLTLAMDMEERYLHYRSQLQTRRLAFDAIPATVLAPKGVNAAVVDAVQRLVDDPKFRKMAATLTDGIAKGYAVVEPVWDYQDKLLKPIAYKRRDQRYFTFEKAGLEDLLLITDARPEGEPLPPGVFITHMPETMAGVPIRRGLARPAAWGFIIQSFSLQDWASFAETYGMPLRLGRYHSGATDKDRRALLNAVAQLGSDAFGIAPAGMEIEFIKAEGHQGNAVFGGIIDYVDRQVSKVVLGQTMTSDNGSSLGQAKIHNEVRLDILRADCRQMADTINEQLIRWFVAMNFGPQDTYPAVHFQVAEPQDIKALSDALDKLVPLGLKVRQGEVREKLGLSEPQKDDELLAAAKREPATPPAQEIPPENLSLRPHDKTGCTCPGCKPMLYPAHLAAGIPPAEPDAVDALLADEDWEKVAAPLLDELFALTATAGSYEEVLQKLDALRVDSGPLRERLAQATAKARGIGDASDEA
jgi:phage gp29-like protein